MQQVNVNGLSLSRLALGTVQLGTPYGIANKCGKPDEQASHSILRTAMESGIRCFDTAGAYGDSEAVLGSYFADKPKPVIVSKIILPFDAHLSAAAMEKEIRRLVELSLEKLKMECIPIMMLHHPDVLALHPETIPAVLRKLIVEGLIGKTGVSFGADIEVQFRSLWPIVNNDLFEAVQVPLNLLDQRLLRNGGLKRLQESHKIVFARSIFMQGLLLMTDEELPDYLLGAAKPLAKLRSLAEREGMSVAQMAVSFVLGMDAVHSLVIGAETAGQVEENVRLLNGGPMLREEAAAIILGRLGPIPERIVNTLLWEKH